MPRDFDFATSIKAVVGRLAHRKPHQFRIRLSYYENNLATTVPPIYPTVRGSGVFQRIRLSYRHAEPPVRGLLSNLAERTSVSLLLKRGAG